VDRFEELKQYKEREGHVDVPQRKGALGIWVVTVRSEAVGLKESCSYMVAQRQLNTQFSIA
jgi:hypothetical protein